MMSKCDRAADLADFSRAVVMSCCQDLSSLKALVECRKLQEKRNAKPQSLDELDFKTYTGNSRLDEIITAFDGLPIKPTSSSGFLYLRL